ncbi:hypothetical protein HAX54_037145, partial [Datura stramonium]|nr:hypothetical protein [Datura stramonium]
DIEEAEHHAQINNMEKLILEHMEVMRENLTIHGGDLKRMSTKLTEMMAKTTTCIDLHFTILVNTQEEPQVEGRIESIQEIDQFVSKKGMFENPKLKLRSKCGVVRPMDERYILLARP